MAFTYDNTTPAGQVRLLAFDIDVANDPIFDDSDITAFLNVNNQDVLLAAAMAVDVMAANQSFAYKHAKTGDIALDISKVTMGLQSYANKLREQAYSGYGDVTGFFDWIEVVNDEFSERERVIKQFLRTQT